MTSESSEPSGQHTHDDSGGVAGAGSETPDGLSARVDRLVEKMAVVAATSPADALNGRIDALVIKLDDLITAVGEQDDKRTQLAHEQDGLRKRLSRLIMALVVVMAITVVTVVTYQSNLVRVQTCKSQNNTREVVRNVLVAAQDSVTKAVPPNGLTGQALVNYNKQVADAKAFYQSQISKVGRLRC